MRTYINEVEAGHGGKQAKVDNSWYKSANGNIPNNYPERIMKYQRITKRVDFGVYDIK